MPIVAICRHWRTASNWAKAFRWREETEDNQLSDEGKKDAISLWDLVKKMVKEKPEDYKIVSSDLNRAVDTAKMVSIISWVSIGNKYFDLRSQDTWDFTNVPEAEVKEEVQDMTDNHPELPLPWASESHLDFIARAKKAINKEIPEDYPDKKIIVVTHHQVEVMQANHFSKLTDAMFGAGIKPWWIRKLALEKTCWCEHCTGEYFKKDIWEDEGDFQDNEDLDAIEMDDYYDEMSTDIQDRLQDQRNDLLLAWIVRTVYNALGKDILDRLANWEASKEDIVKMKHYVSDQAFKKLSSVLDWDAKRVMSLYLLYVANKWGQSIFNQVGVDKEFSFEGGAMHKMIQERVNLLGKWLDETTAKRMWDNIVAWLILWYGLDALNTSLKKLGWEIATDRADLIMTTETNSMLQFSRLQVANTLWATQKIRHTTDDEKTCTICRDLDGETANIDESFNGDAENPPIHPNCRCWIEVVFDWPVDIDQIDSF